MDRTKYFSGKVSDVEKVNQSVSLVLDAFRYSIWQAKLLKNSISYHTIETEIVDLLERICNVSSKIKQLLTNCPLLFLAGDGEAAGGQRGGQGP
jgi:hypothetical protein